MDINAMKQSLAEKIMKTAEQYGFDVSIYRNGNYTPTKCRRLSMTHWQR